MMLLPAVLAASLLPTPTPAVTLPEVRAQLLTGAAVSLPADLRGKPAIIVIGFSQGSRDQVAGWGRRLTPDFHDSTDVLYYEAAELESVPRILRGWVKGKIRDTVPERARAHFFTVQDREAEWKHVAHFAAKDDAYILLIDPVGRVHYTAHGPTSDAAYAQLKQRVEALRAR